MNWLISGVETSDCRTLMQLLFVMDSSEGRIGETFGDSGKERGETAVNVVGFKDMIDWRNDSSLSSKSKKENWMEIMSRVAYEAHIIDSPEEWVGLNDNEIREAMVELSLKLNDGVNTQNEANEW